MCSNLEYAATLFVGICIGLFVMGGGICWFLSYLTAKQEDADYSPDTLVGEE